MKKKNKLSHLLEPGLRLYFITLVCFAVVSAFFNLYLALAEAAIVVVLYYYFRSSNSKRKKEILKYIDNVTCNIDVATKDTMVNAPLPMVIFRPESDEVIWSNERFLAITGEREHLFDTKLTAAVPDFSSRWLMEGKTECPTEVRIGDARYMVFGHLVRTDERGRQNFLATTYWVDVTEAADIRETYYATRPIVAILLLDNYEEILKGLSDNATAALISEVNAKLDEWATPAEGIFCRYNRDHYLFIFEERYLSTYQDGKYGVLDTIHDIISPNGIPVTLSIGIGKDADTLVELFQYANLSIDMALSRGGDQAVIKNRFNFEFYGGRSKELEKRTKVKSRVMATAFSELVGSATRVFIMGHKYPDLDCLGAAAGVVSVCRKRGVHAHIIRDPNPNPAGEMEAKLAALPEYREVFITGQDALVLADAASLLVVVDTNRPEQVLSEELLLSCNKVAV
ncbi:MAG: DHH family phosphoesterase, partial [Pseudoflavonifractor sp.]